MSNGRIIGSAVDSSIISCSGIWDLNDVRLGRSELNWPRPPGTLQYLDNVTGSGTTGGLTLTHPNTVAIGDLCILFHNGWDNDEDTIITTPSGFSVLHLQSYEYTAGSWLSSIISYRILTDTNNVTLPSIAVQTTDGNSTVNPDNQAFTALYFNFDDGRKIESLRVLQTTLGRASSGANGTALTALNVDTQTNTPVLAMANVNLVSGTPAFNASTTAFDLELSITAGANCDTITGYKIYNTVPASAHNIQTDSLSSAQMYLGISVSVQ